MQELKPFSSSTRLPHTAAAGTGTGADTVGSMMQPVDISMADVYTYEVSWCTVMGTVARQESFWHGRSGMMQLRAHFGVAYSTWQQDDKGSETPCW